MLFERAEPGVSFPVTWPPCFIVKSHRSLKIISPPPPTPRVSPVHYKILPHPPHKDSRTKILITDEAELRQISNRRSRSSFNFNGSFFFFFLLFLRIRVHTNRSLYFFLRTILFLYFTFIDKTNPIFKFIFGHGEKSYSYRFTPSFSKISFYFILFILFYSHFSC